MDKKKGIKIRGTATYYEEDHSFEFVSQKEGKPQKENVRKYGSASIYNTTGSQPKTAITLQCPADSVDKKADMVEQFNEILEKEFAVPAKETIKLDGKVLLNEDDCKLTVDMKNATLHASFSFSLTPEGNVDFKNKFYDAIQKLSKCFVINQASIAKCAKSAHLKNSSK